MARAKKIICYFAGAEHWHRTSSLNYSHKTSAQHTHTQFRKKDFAVVATVAFFPLSSALFFCEHSVAVHNMCESSNRMLEESIALIIKYKGVLVTFPLRVYLNELTLSVVAVAFFLSHRFLLWAGPFSNCRLAIVWMANKTRCRRIQHHTHTHSLSILLREHLT